VISTVLAACGGEAAQARTALQQMAPPAPAPADLGATPEPELAPEPVPAAAAEGPMRNWTEPQVQAWLASLRLPKGSDVAVVQRAFSTDETDGDDLRDLKPKRLRRILERAGLGEAATDIARVILARRDAIAQQEDQAEGGSSSPVAEAHPPPSLRWGPLLADRTAEGAERLREAAQAQLEELKPGRWVLELELGRGSSGAVFKSSDARLRAVAIKLSHCGDEPRRLEREAALMQRVSHERVCKLHEHHFSANQQLCAMVMELLEGGNLAQRLKGSPEGRLREFEVLQVGFDVLAALDFMHRQNVIHRDVKPANVVLTSVDGRLVSKLVDFSISAIEQDSREQVSQTLCTGTTALQSAVGTAHYMSPEQIQAGVAITPQTDLWSVGVVLYECLSGAVPFAPRENDRMKIAFAVVSSEPPELSDVIEEVGAVSDPVAAVVLCALEKDMSKRFATAADMIAALEKATQMSGDERFDLFISYRFWCDQGFVWGDQDSLYAACSRCQLRPGREHRLRVYLDKVQIVVSGAVHGLLYGCRWR
jgi:tRNA A-37 threonylcarbamoyl transferase component Bud32